MHERPSLARLARLCGITRAYYDIAGGHHETTASTAEQLLAAMGVDASTEERAAHEIELLLARSGSTRREAGEAHEIDYPPPPSCARIEKQLGDDRAFGLYANLYTVRDAGRFGIGDFSSLMRLVDRTAAIGGDFVAINPLHALSIESGSGCPYAPASRLFVEPLYLDRAALVGIDRETGADWDRLRSNAAIDYAGCWRGARTELAAAFKRWRKQASDNEGRLVAFRRREGDALEDFAAFRTAQEKFGADWRRWPGELRAHDPRALGVFRAESADTIAFHCWLQKLCRERLSDVAQHACDLGLRVGLLLDVALGSPHDSADVWSRREAFATGASIGAPPDPFASEGQNWQLAPLNPLQLDSHGLAFQRDLYGSALRDAGAVRLDHAMGLVRQFWIPEGAETKDGAYVVYPPDLTMGVLAEASRATGAVVVGEDLGTVPDGFRQWMVDAGALRTLVAYFERDHAGAFRGSSEYSGPALATANTHDLPPLAGWLSGDDIAGPAREAADSDGHPDDMDTPALERRRHDVAALLDRLRRERCLAEADTEPTSADVVYAVTAFLAQTPSRLVAVSLDDLGGETSAVNLPGTSESVRANWTRRMRKPLAELCDDPDSARVLSRALQVRVRSEMSFS